MKIIIMKIIIIIMKVILLMCNNININNVMK